MEWRQDSERLLRAPRTRISPKSRESGDRHFSETHCSLSPPPPHCCAAVRRPGLGTNARLEAGAMDAPKWEVIPDDVLVPRRTARRHRVVAGDVQVFGRKPRTNAADIRPGDARSARTAVSADEAIPREKRAQAPPEIHMRDEVRARTARLVPCDAPSAARAGANEPPTHAASRSGVSSEAKKKASASNHDASETPKRVCLRHNSSGSPFRTAHSPRWTKAWRAHTRRTVSALGTRRRSCGAQ